VAESTARTIFSINAIEGINDVLDAVHTGVAEARASDQPIHAAVLPHHTLAGNELMQFWSEIAASNPDPSVIVIIGPNHENAGDAQVQTTTGVWTSPFGNVETDDGIVDALSQAGVSWEPASFVNEHAIGTHIPFIASLYPTERILPVIAKSTADEEDAVAFVAVLQHILPQNALLIASIDFSHYLPRDATETMDEETLSAIDRQAYTEIERMKSDHLDAPFALIAYLEWSERNGFESTRVWHGFSHDLMGNPTAPGTSYLVYFASLPVVEPPVSISAVGDIMLGRAVSDKLGRTTIEQAFSAARDLLANGSLVFGNLESVLSHSQVQSTATYPLKADPELVDALTFMGFTHLSVSNNHIGDFGEAAWEESVAYLEDAGITAIGGYRNDGQPAIGEANGKRVVCLAFETLIRPRSNAEIAQEVAQAAELGDIVVVSFHWGSEYQHKPSPQQVALAHAVIDAGAHVVIGHHPHVLQGVEVYGDGLILYSLGNFIFDQIGEAQNESVLARVTWKDDDRTLELVPARIDGFFPRAATADETILTLDRIASWSDEAIAEELRDGVIHW
jgi:poly-gamma-glutamate synthesis protein (capsule biosynthesis protein)